MSTKLSQKEIEEQLKKEAIDKMNKKLKAIKYKKEIKK
jgi:ribosomal protein S7